MPEPAPTPASADRSLCRGPGAGQRPAPPPGPVQGHALEETLRQKTADQHRHRSKAPHGPPHPGGFNSARFCICWPPPSSREHRPFRPFLPQVPQPVPIKRLAKPVLQTAKMATVHFVHRGAGGGRWHPDRPTDELSQDVTNNGLAKAMDEMDGPPKGVGGAGEEIP
jgi:hypothetical protein